MEKTNTYADLKEASAIAQNAHWGQYRKEGFEYCFHPAHVAMLARDFGANLDTQIMAWLHDVVEDTDTSLNSIYSRFGDHVGDGVKYLSNNGLTHEEYFTQIQGAPEHVQLVKLCDMVDNTASLHLMDIDCIDRKFREASEYYIPYARKRYPGLADMIIKNLCRSFGNLAGHLEKIEESA